MAKSLQDWTLEEAVTPGIRGTDRGANAVAFVPTRAIHCNVTDTYKLTFSSGPETVLMELKTGTTYPFSLTNIVEANDANVTAQVSTTPGDITLIY